MISSRRLFALLPLALFCTAASAGPFSDSQMAKSLGIAQAAKIVFIDANGKEVSENVFFQLQAGKTFSLEKGRLAKGGMVATLRIEGTKRAIQASGPVPGEALPAFVLKDLAGREVRDAELRGKHALLSFYYADCAPCVREVPELNAVAKQHPELRYLAITWDSRAEAAQFVDQRKLSWPVLPEAKSVFNRMTINQVPTLVLVGPDGTVKAVRSGYSQKQSVIAWVDEHL